MDFKAGSLDQRVTLQRGTTSTNGYGEEIPSWADIDTVWASWRRATARETLATAELSAAVSDVFEVRASSTLATLGPKDRLVWEGRTYGIVGVTPLARYGLRIDAVARGE